MYIQILNEEIVKRKINNVPDIIKLRDKLAKELHPKELPSLVTIFAKANNEQK